jgi:hypothetical protein
MRVMSWCISAIPVYKCSCIYLDITPIYRCAPLSSWSPVWEPSSWRRLRGVVMLSALQAANSSLILSELRSGRLCGLVARAPDFRSRGPMFDSCCYQIFWEVAGLERGPLSFVSTIEELLGRESSGSGLDGQEYGCRDQSWRPRAAIHRSWYWLRWKGGERSVGMVRSQTQATELSYIYLSGSCL